MARDHRFAGLTEFLAVADGAGFRAAAAELGVTPAAVSQAIRALETRIGLPLFQRTTRRVVLTEAGQILLDRLRPAAAEIGDALDVLAALRERPSGLLRLSVPRMALPLVVEPALESFRRLYPDVAVEIDVEDAAIDLVEGRFDAGIRIGEAIGGDMVAVRLTPDFRWCVFGAPSYFAENGRPNAPDDLARHQCIRFRFRRARTVYRWEFEKDGRDVSIDPPGGVVVNDGDLALAMAARGLGLAYTADLAASRWVESGVLEPALTGFAPVTPGLCLYFPARNRTQPKLRAFIDVAKGVAEAGRWLSFGVAAGKAD